MTEFVRVVGLRNVTVWMNRVVAKLPESAGRKIIGEFAHESVKQIRTLFSLGAIYHGERRGLLSKSFAYHFEGPFQTVIDSTHPGAEAANYGMLAAKSGKKRVRYPGGNWRVVKGKGVMSKSRGLHAVENGIANVTKMMDGIIDKTLKKETGL